MEPENKPAVPIYARLVSSNLAGRVEPCNLTPAMARPTMKAVEFGATAQSRLPTSKTKMAARYVHLTENVLYMAPYMGCNAVAVRRYAEPSISNQHSPSHI
jgi:hypothetical protein